MKFYKFEENFKYYEYVSYYNLTCILAIKNDVLFYKNGVLHNTKNAAYISYNKYKRISYSQFYLNGGFYGYKKHFNKKSWRKYIKLQVFL
jgi:hypothetical protein